jgi:hypothetical protein
VIAPKLKRRGDNRPLPLPSRTFKTRARAEARGKKGHSYKPLPAHFHLGGFNYRQIARQGRWAIYEQTWSACDDHVLRGRSHPPTRGFSNQR